MSSEKEENYQVRILRDQQTGSRLLEQWKLNNQRHRLDGPAERTWNSSSGVLVREAYFRRNLKHREGGPCIIKRHPLTGEVISETWAQIGSLDRDGDQPALWVKDPGTGVIITEEYWEGGVEHRSAGGPTAIHRDPQTGAVLRIEHHVHGVLVKFEEPQPPVAPQPLEP